MGLLLLAAASVQAQPAQQAQQAPAADKPLRQYTFSWKFLDESSLAPRGGSTTGAQVKLVSEPSPEWQALQAGGLTKFERDRRAILAMAGGYRASFDFLEVAGFRSTFKPSRPYQSWGTEKVYVIEDKGTSIKLQHVLVMSIVGADGKVEGPFVTKHWRQDWQYQPADQLVYRGGNTWERVSVPAAQRRGQWRQTVYQVDDSPRYSGVAEWRHLANFSSWSDADGWRPLPRREYSVRSDYQVLIGSNTHLITPTGWVHEQQNLKVALDGRGKPAGADAVVAREFGLNRYERITDIDWTEGDRYVQATGPVWTAVQAKWDQLIARREPLRLKGAPDKDALFVPLFEYAQGMADGGKPKTPEEIRRHVDEAVEAYLLPTAGNPR
ncbi:MAG: hypothetical protein RLZZ618_2517 [Pseudomonadota bacterium]